MNLKVKLITLKRGLLAKLQAAGLSAGEPAVIWDDTSKPRLAVGDRDGVPREVVGAAHIHAPGEVTGLEVALAGKASSTHSHATSEVTGLETLLEPEILVETAAHEALARIERLERAFQMLELGPSRYGLSISDVAQLQTELDGLASASSALVKISEIILTSDQASVSFTSISQDYRNLRLVCTGRGTRSETSVDVKIKFNNDSSAIYDYDGLFQENGTSVGVFQSLDQTSATFWTMTGANSPTNQAGTSIATIFDYARTTFLKNMEAKTLLKKTSSGLGHTFFSVCWRSTSAISTITITPTSGNFVAGSLFVLYGEK